MGLKKIQPILFRQIGNFEHCDNMASQTHGVVLSLNRKTPYQTEAYPASGVQPQMKLLILD